MVDHELQVTTWKFFDELFHQPDRRIARVADAENDLQGLVVQQAKRPKALVKARLQPANRLKYGNGRPELAGHVAWRFEADDPPDREDEIADRRGRDNQAATVENRQ